MSIEKMREEFEAWSAEHDYLGGCAAQTLDDRYRDIDLQHAWESWQASAQGSRSALASQLVSTLSINRGRPIEWREAIEITAIITGMDPQEKQRLLDMDDD